MKYIADFHLHSKYSRATSKDMDLEHISQFAKIKGIDVLGTGDFTHPEWFKNLKAKLRPENGLFKLKNSNLRFILTSEISSIYFKKGKTRKVHILVFAPSFQVVEKINNSLGKIGNLSSDGRPILGLDAEELTKIVLNISKDCLIIPAHVLTPWFGVFGSKSGFDSIQDCFGDYSKYIYGLETGLSANPPMLWRMADSRNRTLISSSDAHSPKKLGREATVFEGNKLSYDNIAGAIKGIKGKFKLLSTIEFYPQEGKYYYDGHRNCEVSLSPLESRKYNNVCPVCQKLLTIGVLNKAEQLSDKPEGFKPSNAIPFKSLIPLKELIAEVLKIGLNTKKVEKEYDNLIKKIGSEFKILLEASSSDLEEISSLGIAKAIISARKGKINIEPGFDGVFGKISISPQKNKPRLRQKILF